MQQVRDYTKTTECLRCGEEYTREEFVEHCIPHDELTATHSRACSALADGISMDVRHCSLCSAPVSMVVVTGT